MNTMCLSCPRYTPGYQYAQGENWYTAHRCPGTACENWTGCARRPFHPLENTIDLYYDIDSEKWEPKTYNAETGKYEIRKQEVPCK